MTKKFAAVIAIVMMLASCAFGASYTINSYDDFLTYMRNSAYTSVAENTFTLNADIQLAGYSNWPGIGTEASPFLGTFNGNGHTIYVNIRPLPPTGSSYTPVANDRALFVYVGEDAVIQDLKVEGSVHGYNAGGIASILDGGTISNCSFSGDVVVTTRTGDANITALISNLSDSQIQVANDIEKFDDLTSHTAHRGRINAGGLAAVMEDGSITNCSFRGTVRASSTATYATAGGMAGRMFNGDITGCSVVGDSLISASTGTNNNYSIAEAGGIAGYTVTLLESTIEDCTFEGSVESTYYAGGIAGIARGTQIYGNSVLANSDITGTYSSGGIIGYLSSGGTAVSNDVEAGAIVMADTYSAGGIVGYLETGRGSVTDNDSDAAIRGDASYLGGIVGAVSNSTNAASAVGTGNTYSGASAGIGRDEYNKSTDGNTTPKQDVTYEIITSSLSDGTVGVKYEAKLETNAAQTRTVTYTYSGTLPDGLSFASNGTISGTPTAAGDFTFSARANVEGFGNTASKDFTVSVVTKFDITPVIESELTGTEGVLFTQSFSANNGALITAKGSLPAGVTQSPSEPASSITLSGYPQKSGTYTFTIEGTSGDVTYDTDGITLVVNPAIEFATTSLNPASATQGTAYSANLDVYLNVPRDALNENSLEWSISSGHLPAGLAISGGLSGGKITGTPQRPGDFTFTVKAELSMTAGTTSLKFPITQEFSLSVAEGTGTTPTSGDATPVSGDITSGDAGVYGVSINDDSLPNGKEDVAYSYTFTSTTNINVNVSTNEVSWRLSNGTLPPGLSLDVYGKLSGTPTRAGEYVFTVEAHLVLYRSYNENLEPYDVSGRRRFTMTIDPAFNITTDASLTSATAGTNYSLTLATDTAQAAAVRWSLLDGALPEGLSLNPLNGTISGTPTKIEIATFTIQAAVGDYIAVKRFTLAVGPTVNILDDTPLENARIGVSYSHTFRTDSSYSVVWSHSGGNLPAGLVFSNGTLSGTPTAEGTYTFTLNVESGGMTSSKEFTLVVVDRLSIVNESPLPHANLNEFYLVNFTADVADSQDVTWSITDGNLPANFKIDSSTGVFTGYPETEGTYNFTVSAFANGLTVTKDFTFTAGQIMNITTNAVIPVLDSGSPYSLQLTTDINSTNSVWSVSEGRLPPGLSLNTNTGLISGTPARAGAYTFTVKNVSGNSEATKEFTLNVGFVITSEAYLPNGTSGQNYSYRFTAQGVSSGAVLWSASQDVFPTGIKLNSDGLLSGTTNESGKYSFTVSAFVSNDVHAQKMITLTIDSYSTLPILTTELPAGQVGQDYYAEIMSNAENVAWTLSEGTLPPGLTFRSQGAISGTPTASGTYTFVVKGTSGTRTGSRSFTLTIAPAASSPVSPDNSSQSTSSSGGGGGGGCNSGFGLLGLALLLTFRKR